MCPRYFFCPCASFRSVELITLRKKCNKGSEGTQARSKGIRSFLSVEKGLFVTELKIGVCDITLGQLRRGRTGKNKEDQKQLRSGLKCIGDQKGRRLQRFFFWIPSRKQPLYLNLFSVYEWCHDKIYIIF